MDPQIQQRLIMFGGLIPGAIAMVVLLAAWYIHAFKASRIDHAEDGSDEESGRRSDGPRWVLPILLAVGFVGADYASNDSFQLWPEANNYRFTHAIGLVMLVGVIEGLVRLPMTIGFVLRAVGFGGAFWMLSEGYVPGVFADSSVLIGSAIFAGLASSLVASAADRNSEETPAWVDSISWLVIAGASMPIFLQNYFSTGAGIPTGASAVFVSTLIVGLIFRDLRLSRGGVTVLVGFMLTMLVGSIIQTGVVNLPAALLLALSPMVMMVPRVGKSNWRLLGARLVMLGAVLGSSAGLIFMAGSHDADAGESGDSYMDYLNDSSNQPDDLPIVDSP